MKIKLSVLSVLFLFMFTGLLFAQKSNELNKKLDKVKEAKKIVISTDNGDLVFDGKDAQTLLKRMKINNMKRIRFISEGDSILTEDFEGPDSDDDVMVWNSVSGGKKIIKHIGNGNKMMMFMDDDSDLADKKIVKIKVEDEDGEKTVTKTTTENGEKNIETYTGKEADEFLKKMEKDEDISIDIGEDSDSINVWVQKNDDNKIKVNKKVKIEVENGVKKVTVITNENGKENIKTYTGDEAEKYLKDHKSDDKGDKNIKKKIILK